MVRSMGKVKSLKVKETKVIMSLVVGLPEVSSIL